MTTPSAMPGARPTVAGSVASLITALADIADNGSEIDLDTVDSLAALTAAYASLVQAQADRKAPRNG